MKRKLFCINYFKMNIIIVEQFSESVVLFKLD